MSERWQGCLKIHEGCGGHVRWVEAVRRPGVGYHGDCLGCNETELPVEQIIPIELPDDVRQAREHEYWDEFDLDTWRRLVWNDDRDWERNQYRIQRALNA